MLVISWQVFPCQLAEYKGKSGLERENETSSSCTSALRSSCTILFPGSLTRCAIQDIQWSRGSTKRPLTSINRPRLRAQISSFAVLMFLPTIDTALGTRSGISTAVSSAVRRVSSWMAIICTLKRLKKLHLLSELRNETKWSPFVLGIPPFG